jgi:thiol-disulfide isomerase/thioredoxin
MGEIVAAHSERPFILAFWSLTCTHCRDELTLFGNLQRQYPGIDIVLVSTDTPEESAAIQATLSEFKLAQAEAWVFADSFADRLRFEVDKKWHGELPRTYFFAPGEQRKAYSGKLRSRDVVQWVKNVSRP